MLTRERKVDKSRSESKSKANEEKKEVSVLSKL